MATKKSSEKITIHPRSQRKMKIAAEIYDPFKEAILNCLKGKKGKTFAELTAEVSKIIRKKMPGFKGSVPWYTISVRLDLETKGLVETFMEKGKKYNRLKK